MEDNINMDILNGEVDAGFCARACSRLGTKNNKLKEEILLKDKIIKLMANDILTNYIVNVEDIFAYDEYPSEPMTLEYILNKYENQAKGVEN